ncbi:MAG: zinc-ribbon domain-containing protein, partial [Terriglobia bacterium]
IKEAEQATDEEMDPLEAEIQAERAGAAKAEPRRKKSATAGTCANCGQAYTAADKFCAGCGRPLGVTGLQCPKCSAKVRKGDKFCESCGEKL